MEIKFNKTTCPCMRMAVSEVKNQEQTQEVRLPESMPDIGRVLGCWGQALVRSKEWRGSSMSVSGGVMAWVLYAPEDGSAPKSVETWIPYQMRWELPDPKRDGSIIVTAQISNMDARSISARKLMIRANISVLGQAMEPVEPEICTPEEVPADVQLLKVSYPLELPQEAGEKLFQVDEELTLPSSSPKADAILRYEAWPKILETNVMAGRVVFRGVCTMQMLYEGDGGLHRWGMDLPFSQYAELDRDHSDNASADVNLMVTGLELGMGEEGKLLFKCGMAAQYVLFDRVMIQLVEDAYSPHRSASVTTEPLELPVCLNRQCTDVRVETAAEADAERMVDVCWMPEHPRGQQNGDVLEMECPGQFGVLWYDREGTLQSGTVRAQGQFEMPSDEHNRVYSHICSTQLPQGVMTAQGAQLSCDLTVHTAACSTQGLPMVTELSVGDEAQPDPQRPSLILRRMGDDRLWDIAKSCGSTVDAICKANSLTCEPEQGRMLLIPIT